MDVFLKQNEEKENVPKVSEEAILNAKADAEQRADEMMKFFNAMPRKMKRKMLPQAKFGNQLMKRMAEKNKR